MVLGVVIDDEGSDGLGPVVEFVIQPVFLSLLGMLIGSTLLRERSLYSASVSPLLRISAPSLGRVVFGKYFGSTEAITYLTHTYSTFYKS